MFKTLMAAAVALCSICATQSVAATLSFSFSFGNERQSAGSIVTGIVSGLNDNATGAASSVTVTSNTAGFGLGEYVGNPKYNRFTVAGGQITSFEFAVFGEKNAAPDVTCCNLGLSSNYNIDPNNFGAGLQNGTNVISYNYGRDNNGHVLGLSFTPIPPITAVPLPAAGWLLLASLGGFSALRRRKRAA